MRKDPQQGPLLHLKLKDGIEGSVLVVYVGASNFIAAHALSSLFAPVTTDSAVRTHPGIEPPALDAGEAESNGLLQEMNQQRPVRCLCLGSRSCHVLSLSLRCCSHTLQQRIALLGQSRRSMPGSSLSLANALLTCSRCVQTRPMTYDLFKNVFERLGHKVRLHTLAPLPKSTCQRSAHGSRVQRPLLPFHPANNVPDALLGGLL